MPAPHFISKAGYVKAVEVTLFTDHVPPPLGSCGPGARYHSETTCMFSNQNGATGIFFGTFTVAVIVCALPFLAFAYVYMAIVCVVNIF